MQVHKFKQDHSVESRKKEAEKIMTKYADRVPIIIEKLENNDIPEIDKKKYLVPNDITVGQFKYIIRRRIKLTPEKALFIFTHDYKLPNTGMTVASLYREYKDECNFLYLFYGCENTFGFSNHKKN
jgi:GABA(A) receptor-associated protein